MTQRHAHIPPGAVPRLSDQVMFQNLEGESVLLDLASESYFGLNEVGARVWELIDGTRSLDDIHRVLVAEYDADEAAVREDLARLTSELSERGLIQFE